MSASTGGPRISAAIITLNEEKHIAECLAGLAWCDEIVVVDSGSTDQTVLLAQSRGARVLSHPFANYAEQKNLALSACSGDWILSIDADERVTPELAAEIRQALGSGTDVAGYYLNRKDWMFGRWIEHGEWFPQYKLRLVRRGMGSWQGAVHEVLVASGPTARLHSPLLHYAAATLADFLGKVERYSTMEAEARLAAGAKPSLFKMIAYPPALFLRDYVWKRGFLDGTHGFVLCTLMAYYSFLKRAKHWDMYQRRASKTTDEHG